MEFSAAPIDLVALLQMPEPRALDAQLPTDAALAAQWAAPFAAALSAEQRVAASGEALPRDGNALPRDVPRAGLPVQPQAAVLPPPLAGPVAPPAQDLTASANRALATQAGAVGDGARAVSREAAVTLPRVGGDPEPVAAPSPTPERAPAGASAAAPAPRADEAAARVLPAPPVLAPGGPAAGQSAPARRLPPTVTTGREPLTSVSATPTAAEVAAPVAGPEPARAAVIEAPAALPEAVLEAAAPRVAESVDAAAAGRSADAAVPQSLAPAGIQLTVPAAAEAAAGEAADAPDPQPARFSESVAGQVRYMIDHKLGEAKLNLNPPELGSLEIKISFVEDKAHVHIVAQHSQARDALEQGLPRLRELLTLGGMDLGGASVSGGREERAGADSPMPEPADAAPFLDADAGAAAPVVVSPAGRVDLYA